MTRPRQAGYIRARQTTDRNEGERVSDIECPLPKRSQLRAARSQAHTQPEEEGSTAPLPLTPAAADSPGAGTGDAGAVSTSGSVEPVNAGGPRAASSAPAESARAADDTGGTRAEEASSAGRRRGHVHPVGYVLRALLVVGLAGATIAVPMTGRVGSDSSLTVPARAFGASVGGTSWATSSALPQATQLDATLTANSRAKAKAPVSITGCAAGNGADGNRSVKVVADAIYWPLPEGSFVITSPFTTRISPVSGQLLAHEGIDMAARMDTPVTSVYAGVVEELAENSRSGAYVQIKHTKADGTVFHSAYLHQYMNKITVKLGDTVTAGQVIGAVGNNGWSTGPHLHFEIHDSSDTPIDPEAWMKENKAIYLGQESCS